MSHPLPTYDPTAQMIQRFLEAFLEARKNAMTPDTLDRFRSSIRGLDLRQCKTTTDYTAYHQAYLEGLTRLLKLTDVRVPEIREALPEQVDGYVLAVAHRLVAEAQARQHLLQVADPRPGHFFASWPGQ